MRLGIFGGTFNPVHIGHITASLHFYDDVKLDMLLVIPDRIPPHKEGYVASAEHRLAMLRLVYEDVSVIGERTVRISETELDREGKSYTIITLRELKSQYPDAELFLYTGSDMFYTLEKWREGASILEMCSVYTCAREKDEHAKLESYARIYKEKYGTNCIVAKHEPVISSSTEIRERLQAKNDENCCIFTNKLLTDSVNRYIMENGLYRNDNENSTGLSEQTVYDKLPGLVTEKRLSHILAVKDTASMLADTFLFAGAKLCKEKVILASLLHDITKCIDQDELCQRFGIVLTEDDKASMQTVHAITGAYYAKNIFGADDEITSAIEKHTVGGKEMSLTDKIIFVSDYCEETRKYEACITSRKMLLEMVEKVGEMPEGSSAEFALRSLDLIVADILGKTVMYLRDRGEKVHPGTLRSFKDICAIHCDDEDFRLIFKKYIR